LEGQSAYVDLKNPTEIEIPSIEPKLNLPDGHERQNLTEIELASIEAKLNLSDGHARQNLTPSQHRIVRELGDVFMLAAEASPAQLDARAQSAFLGALGQHAAISDAEVLSCYSSSVAMEILARSLQAENIQRVALVHPTFDNIPDILRGLRMDLLPVDERALMDGSAQLPADTQVLFITTPNNPTGQVLPADVLAHWARVCSANNIIIALDTSFRGFDERAQYDHYEILGRAGCRYVIMEDTGKLWPTLDLKIGFLGFSDNVQLPLRRIHTDILLGVSPFILLMVRRFAEDAAEGGFSELRRFVHSNRFLLRDRLSPLSGISFPDPASRISVERLAVPADLTGSAMFRALVERDIHVLPCRQFYWADPDAGERFIRLALSRPREVIATAATAIRSCIECL
jgi:enduracididine biosynthesis enzyme MppP